MSGRDRREVGDRGGGSFGLHSREQVRCSHGLEKRGRGRETASARDPSARVFRELLGDQTAPRDLL